MFEWILHAPLDTVRYFNISVPEKCLYSEFFYSVFSRSQTEYGEILRIFPYLRGMRENTEQKNCEYGHFLRSVFFKVNLCNLALIFKCQGNIKK